VLLHVLAGGVYRWLLLCTGFSRMWINLLSKSLLPLRLTTLPPSCAVILKSENLNFLETSGPLHVCNGIALPLPLTWFLPDHQWGIIYISRKCLVWADPVAAPSKAWVSDRSHVGIAGSNPIGGMDVVCIVWCFFRGLCDGLITSAEGSYRVWCVLSVMVKPR
jgi:hypothetical protein